jgi:hypothetical protein
MRVGGDDLVAVKADPHNAQLRAAVGVDGGQVCQAPGADQLAGAVGERGIGYLLVPRSSLGRASVVAMAGGPVRHGHTALAASQETTHG